MSGDKPYEEMLPLSLATIATLILVAVAARLLMLPPTGSPIGIRPASFDFYLASTVLDAGLI